MNYRHLTLNCQCGKAPERIDEVGLTDDHQLVIHWWCAECRKLVYTSKPLAECWLACPSPENSLDVRLQRLDNHRSYEAEDARFLQSIGVRVS